MRVLLFLFCFCLITGTASAEKYYVFIDKVGKVEKGQEAGQNQYGDVISIAPYTSQYKPTRGELARFKVVVMDLTQEEKDYLTEPEQVISYVDPVTKEEHYETVRARKRKIDIDQLSFEQKQEVDKNVVLEQVITKQSIITP